MVATHRPDVRGEPPPDQIVELRVHGVGGTPPEEILDVPVTCLVAGDESSGFFRPWQPGPPAVPGLEAYSWGGLTSASRLRALWVLLSPFALANLAGWMLRHGGEPADTGRRTAVGFERFGVGVVRAFGLIITVALASHLAVAVVDMVGFQCGGDPACVADRWWLAPWGNRLVAGNANRAAAVGAVLAAGAVVVVAWLARRSQIALHAPGDFSSPDDPALEVNLNHSRLWESPGVAHRLGLTHTAAALAAVGLCLAHPAGQVGDLGGWATAAGWSLLLAALGAVVWLGGVPSFVHIGLVVGSLIYLLLTLVSVGRGAGLTGLDGPLPGADTVTVVLLPVGALATLVAVVVVSVLWRKNRHGPLRAAMVAPALLALAAGLVAAVGSGLLIRLADVLGRPRATSEYRGDGASPRAVIVYSDLAGDIAVVTVLSLMVLAAAVAVAWLTAGPGPSCVELAARYAQRGGLDCDDPDDRRWAAEVGRAEAVATVTDRAASVLWGSAVVVLAGLAATVAFSDDPSGLGLGAWAEPLTAPSSLVLGLIPPLAVAAVARLYRRRAVRRVVGILWDVAIFWPRWFHPWSPPSYGERAVMQLGHRTAALAQAGGVVVSAHSQGSVLAAATLCRASPAARSRTALLTHGSPLTRLYARFFPEYFSSELFSTLAATTRGWINLWRPTDFIGGPIAAEGVADRRVLDPPSSRSAAPGEPRPVPSRHSHYERTEEYRTAVEQLKARIGTP